jgi:hypothetical protein
MAPRKIVVFSTMGRGLAVIRFLPLVVSVRYVKM